MTMFAQQVQDIINHNSRKLMRANAKQLKIAESIKRHFLRKRQFMWQNLGETWSEQNIWLKKFKHPKEHSMLWFFTDVKNFNQNKNMNSKNDRCLYSDPKGYRRQVHIFMSVLESWPTRTMSCQPTPPCRAFDLRLLNTEVCQQDCHLMWPTSNYLKFFTFMSSPNCGLQAFLIWIPHLRLHWEETTQLPYSLKATIRDVIANMNEQPLFRVCSCFQC